jgi:hypothetical protein
MLPAPLQKTPQISPIFISDKVTLPVSREKGAKFPLVCAEWDDRGSFSPTAAGKLVGGGRVGSDPPRQGAMNPPLQKLGPPPLAPLVFPAIGAAHVHRTVHFLPSFLRSRYLAPSVMRNGSVRLRIKAIETAPAPAGRRP